MADGRERARCESSWGTQSSWYSGQRQPLKRDRRVAVCTVRLGDVRSEETFQVENTVCKAESEGA